MKGFTVKMALVDALPVLFFSTSIVIISGFFDSVLFSVGAVLMALSGVCKVTWKLMLGLNKGDIKWLNKIFLPMMMTGFFGVIIALLFNFKKINFTAVYTALISFPSFIFFIAALVAMVVMISLSKKFKRDDASDNWRAQIVNTIMQACLLIGLLLI